MDSRPARSLTIGKLAKRARVGVETIRFYEREGLLPQPPRDASSGYRKYPETSVHRLEFVGRAKQLGFTLREIRELLALRSSAEVTCATFQTRTLAKLEDVRRKIRDLQHIEVALESLADACPGAGGVGDCSILAALDGRFAHGEG